MNYHRTTAIVIVGLGLLFAEGATAIAQSKTITIGVLEDQSGLYADATGVGSTLATQMAVEDSGLLQKNWKVNVSRQTIKTRLTSARPLLESGSTLITST